MGEQRKASVVVALAAALLLVSCVNAQSSKTFGVSVESSPSVVAAKLELPQIFRVIHGGGVFGYENMGRDSYRVTLAEGHRIQYVRRSGSVNPCFVSCSVTYAVVSHDDESFPTETSVVGAEYTFRIERTMRGALLTTSYKLVRSNRVLVNYHDSLFGNILDRAVRVFGLVACENPWPSMSGLCRNPRKPLAGSAGATLSRMAKRSGVVNPRYADQCSAPEDRGIAGPRTISNKISRIPAPIDNRRRILTNFFVTFGQFMVHDLVLTPGGNGPFKDTSMNIRIRDPSDGIFNQGIILFSRSRYMRTDLGSGYVDTCPRQHSNLQTAYLDASQVYGFTNEHRYLREFRDGLMKTNRDYRATGIHCPNNTVSLGLQQALDPSPSSPNFLAAGDPRANENAVLLSLHTLFLREHNRVARELKPRCSGVCNDETLFQTARRIVEMELQFITYEEWLPLFLGPKIQYRGFKGSAEAGILHEAATSALRFGHSMQPDEHLLLGPGNKPHEESEVRLRDSFFNPSLVLKYGIEPFLRGAAKKDAQQFDHLVSEDLRNFLFKKLPTLLGVDLLAANIQRGRDHGLPSYNDARRMCGLAPKDFLGIAGGRRDMAEVLENLYTFPDRVELFVGGVAEPRLGGELGETFLCIVRKQFVNLAESDWQFYKNQQSLTPLMRQSPTVQRILRGDFSMKQVVVSNTDIKTSDLQNNVFLLPPGVKTSPPTRPPTGGPAGPGGFGPNEGFYGDGSAGYGSGGAGGAGGYGGSGGAGGGSGGVGGGFGGSDPSRGFYGDDDTYETFFGGPFKYFTEDRVR